MIVAAAAAAGASFLLGAATTWFWQYHNKKKGDDNDDDVHNRNEQFPAPRRFGGAIRLAPDRYQRYRELHDNVWEPVLERMHRSNIRNFVIYYHAETSTLFQSFEWIGHWRQHPHENTNDKDEEQLLLARDMQAIANDPVTRQWWAECEPCQEPFSQWAENAPPPSQGGGGGDWWAPLECVCHTGHWPTAYSSQRRDVDFVKLRGDASANNAD